MPGSIELQQGADLLFEVVDGGSTLRVRVPAGLFAKLADLTPGDGANLIGFDRLVTAWDTDTLGEVLAEVLGFKKGLVSLANHISFNPVNDGADIQLLLPQALGTGSDVEFARVRSGRLGLPSSGGALTIASIGAGAGSTANAGSFVLSGAGWFHRVQLTVSGTTSGALQTVATFNFPAAYASPPFVVLIPEGRNASALQGAASTACAVTSVTTTGFTLTSGTTTPLNSGTQYSWNFLVIGG